jgi:drug/metabolite transporter (DMT)-like permease
MADIVNLSQLAPILLSLASATLFAISIQILHQGLRHTDSESGSLVQIGTTTICYWLFAPWLVESWYWLTPAALLFVIVGLFKPAVSANASLLGVHYLGPTPTSTLAATSPLFAAAFAVLFLDERLTVPIVVGTMAIMAGSIALAQRGSGARRGNWPLWALGLPLLAAFVRATGDGLTKFAMLDLPSPHFAGLVSFSVSLIVASIVFGARRRSLPKLGRRHGTGWFALAGTINAVSVYCLNLALQLGDLIVVIPIVSASPFITLLLSVFLIRRESITAGSLMAVFLVVPGVVMIALGR